MRCKIIFILLTIFQSICFSIISANIEFKENIPPWAEGDPAKVIDYYKAHKERRYDRFLGEIASRLGVIVHGNISQDKLAINLKCFDITGLMEKGPSPSPALSMQAQQLIYDSLHDIERVVDVHLHNFGYDEGNYVNPKASVPGTADLPDYFTFMVCRYAAGMTSPIGSTQEARKRLQLYAMHFPKLSGWVLPIQKAILPDGTIDWENTGNYLTNKSALLTACSFEGQSSELLPAVSVHPFDLKWMEKLLTAHAKGIRLVKWMPPQSIPPDSDLLDPYYEAMKQLGMTLIAHAGPEHAIPTHEGNKHWADWGNPLRFRKPLQMGVNVILAHCGHKDEIPDLDDPAQSKVPGYQLFIRLAREAHQKNLSGEWSGKLFGDLAAVTNHYGPDFVKELLLHANEDGIRFLYGSDYPYSNLVRPKNDAYDVCAQYGLLDSDKVEPLKEIRNWNPLLANYVFTKNLRLQMPEGQILQFPESTFTGYFSDADLPLIDRAGWENCKASYQQ